MNGHEYRIVSDDISRGEVLRALGAEKLKFMNGAEYFRGVLYGIELAEQIVCSVRMTGVWNSPKLKPLFGYKHILKLKRGDFTDYTTAAFSKVWDSWENCERNMEPVPDSQIAGWRQIPE